MTPREAEAEIARLQELEKRLRPAGGIQWLQVRSRLLSLMLDHARWDPPDLPGSGDLAVLRRDRLRGEDGYLREVEDVPTRLL